MERRVFLQGLAGAGTAIALAGATSWSAPARALPLIDQLKELDAEPHEGPASAIARPEDLDEAHLEEARWIWFRRRRRHYHYYYRRRFWYRRRRFRRCYVRHTWFGWRWRRCY